MRYLVAVALTLGSMVAAHAADITASRQTAASKQARAGEAEFRALYKELVESGRMTATDFHDAILLGGPMPIELVRARLMGTPLDKDFRSRWRFYGDPVPAKRQ